MRRRYSLAMCNLYTSPTEQEVWDYWDVSGPLPPLRFFENEGQIAPRRKGPFLRPNKETGRLECVLGRWQLVPRDWPTIDYPYATNNARWEDKVRVSRTFRPVWQAGQRCVIPVRSFQEPCWETGSHVPWHFQSVDGKPLGLAGLWNTWVSKETGELIETYTMITVNADTHPLMSRMHKADPDDPEKRMVAVLAPKDQQAWLFGSSSEAEQVIRQWPVEKIWAAPVPRTKRPQKAEMSHPTQAHGQGDLF